MVNTVIYDSGKRVLVWENQRSTAQWTDINKINEKPSNRKRGQSMNEQSANEDTQIPLPPGELAELFFR